ncbi:dihydroneopterin aldolase [Polynucleobacter antarcticus]|uniref:Dihydroneopterin aldolase/epimerase domain-containing protein n=1 Tax=Polynucleobacter antarcticus TaxID=1743162 RepID=A0A6M9PU94_9BURK|nr:dihydroneopterin aldolase [Polynucleobacter antarcticus]QKM62437.1 hypothetical protein DCO16_04790 [Polynucleobacter antarcticus]
MNQIACIELRDLELQTHIGSYAPNATIPKKHLLDLTLWIDAKYILIGEDKMEHVFDYDPLISEIHLLAEECHYETQERLITKIVQCCAKYVAIESMEIGLRKLPVSLDSGELGIRLKINRTTLNEHRIAI